ncbi:MAG: signal peptidase II [Clostridia bacterium]|nr:signal peptidase II [Clostridia bacterium]
MKTVWKYGWIALLVIATDQVTKRLALSLETPVTLIPGVLGLRLTRNTGVAFSLLSGSPVLVTVLSGVVLVIGGLLLWRFRLGALSLTGAMLIVGGALSNMLSRVFEGSVIDMIEFLFVNFAVFNAADIALTVGCGLLILSILFRPDEWKPRHE